MADNNTKIIISARDETAAAFSSVKSSLSSLTSSYGALAGLMSGAVIGGTIALIKKNIDLADGLNDLSQKYGTSVETLAGFSLAAEQSGTSLDAIAKGLNKLSVELTNSPERFDKLGISTSSATEAMIQMADIFAAMPDGAEKTALAISLFGKSGADLIPLLNGGTEAMRKQIQTGGELAQITTENAKLADEFNDNLAILSAASSGAGMAMTKNLLGPLTDISKAMAQAAKDGSVLKAVWVGLGGLGAALFTDEFTDPAVKARKTVDELKIELAKLEGANGLGKLWYGKDIDKQISETKAKLTKAVSDLGAIINKPPETKETKKDTSEASRKACELANGTWDGKKCIMPDGKSVKSEPRTAQPEDYAARISQAVGSAISGSDLVKAREYAATVEALDALFFDTGLDADIYSSAMDRLTKSKESSIQPTKTLVELFSEENATAIARVNQQREMIGMREKDIAVLEATRKIEDAATEARKNAFRDIKDPALYQQAIEGINTALEVQKKEMADATASVYDYSHSWESGATIAVGKYLDEVENMASKSEQLVSKAFNGMEDALVGFVRTGKLDFTSLADSIISDLIRIQIQQSIMKPLTQAMSGGGGFGDMLGGLFGNLSTAFTYGTNVGSQQTAMLAAQWHTGGGPGDTPAAHRLLPAAVFADAPRFHTGIGPGERAAVIRTDESVLTPGQMRQLAPVGAGGASLTVNIIESPGNGGKQQQRSDGNGNQILDVFVEKVKGAIASDITRGSGAVPAALGSTYGLNRVAGAY